MTGPWSVTVGHTAAGQASTVDLSQAPHALLCGTSGSGKSVGVHALIAGLVTGGTPADTQITIGDVKRVEFGIWARAPHVAAVLTDRDDICKAILGMVKEMDRRYAVMERQGAIDMPSGMPRLFLVIDELADLTMMSKVKADRERAALVLGGLTRIAQLGRAAGVHLIVATQRPAADTLPGCLRANLGTRWAFRVRTRAESRIALDAPGAESLDSAPGTSLLSWRGAEGSFVQGLYISREGIAATVAAAVAQYGAARRTMGVRAPSRPVRATGGVAGMWAQLGSRARVWVAAGVGVYVGVYTVTQGSGSK